MESIFPFHSILFYGKCTWSWGRLAAQLSKQNWGGPFQVSGGGNADHLHKEMPAISLKNDDKRRGLSSESQLTTRLKKKIISPSDHWILYCENYSIKFFQMTWGVQRFFACSSAGECIQVWFLTFSTEGGLYTAVAADARSYWESVTWSREQSYIRHPPSRPLLLRIHFQLFLGSLPALQLFSRPACLPGAGRTWGNTSARWPPRAGSCQGARTAAGGRRASPGMEGWLLPLLLSPPADPLLPAWAAVEGSGSYRKSNPWQRCTREVSSLAPAGSLLTEPRCRSHAGSLAPFRSSVQTIGKEGGKKKQKSNLTLELHPAKISSPRKSMNFCYVLVGFLLVSLHIKLRFFPSQKGKNNPNNHSPSWYCRSGMAFLTRGDLNNTNLIGYKSRNIYTLTHVKKVLIYTLLSLQKPPRRQEM